MIITLLTDFGTQDTFVGVVKCVIKDIAPRTEIIDLCHAIPRHDIAAGAFALKTGLPYFPPETIHLAVVDPGVGSARRPIAVRAGNMFWVCPDNGLLSYVLAAHPLQDAVHLDDPRFHRQPVSRTFHARDIFAPAAAHLSLGLSPADMGTPIDHVQTFPLSVPNVFADRIETHVLCIDVFGNVLTDLTEDRYDTWRDRSGQTVIRVGERPVAGPVSAYSDVPAGRLLAVFGSSGHLEIAVREGDAGKELGLRRGDRIVVSRERPTG